MTRLLLKNRRMGIGNKTWGCQPEGACVIQKLFSASVILFVFCVKNTICVQKGIFKSHFHTFILVVLSVNCTCWKITKAKHILAFS